LHWEEWEGTRGLVFVRNKTANPTWANFAAMPNGPESANCGDCRCRLDDPFEREVFAMLMFLFVDWTEMRLREYHSLRCFVCTFTLRSSFYEFMSISRFSSHLFNGAALIRK
jgi:hypothetical protein